MKILYVGPTLAGSTALQRLVALRALGQEVFELRSTDLALLRSSWQRIGLKLGLAADLDGANAALREGVGQGEWDLVWFDKPITIRRSTLDWMRRRAPGLRLVAYSPAVMLFLPNRTRRWVRCLPAFDVVFTTKPHNVAPLLGLGARRVELVKNAYAEETHKPWPRCAADRVSLGGGIGFIGDFEEARRRSIALLARSGLRVRIWGPNWSSRWPEPPAGVVIEGRSLIGDEYARAICNFDINLAFLRKAARDEITTRSLEIPACGGFMLAERTTAQRAMFAEGREAVFFASDEELLSQCRYFLEHPEQARQIGERGRERCLREGYGNQARLRQMLDRVMAVS